MVWKCSQLAALVTMRLGNAVCVANQVASGAYVPGTPQQLQELAAAVNTNSHGIGAGNSSNIDRWAISGICKRTILAYANA